MILEAAAQVLEAGGLAYYYYAFYDLNYYSRNLGMFMMTSAVGFFAERGFNFLYLGSCYFQNALYKTQFAGAEFFNGFRWSRNPEELKHLIRVAPAGRHRLETPEFLAFQAAPLDDLAQATLFRAGP